MKYRIEMLPSAWEDLKAVEDWYLLNFGGETAIKVSDSILEAVERLEEFPDSGSRTPDAWLNNMGYRMVIAGRHVAIYKRINDCVYVYHIADTRTAYNRLFYSTITPEDS